MVKPDYEIHPKFVMGWGSYTSKVMVVGTAPGEQEELTGIAFTGNTGRLLKDLLADVGVVSAYYTNIVRYRCDKKPSMADRHKCRDLLLDEFWAMKPKLVITLGQIPLEFFYNRESRISQQHGLLFKTRRHSLDYHIMPLYDLGYVMRKGGLFSPTGEEWLHDLETLRNKIPEIMNDNKVYE